jgi:hypothetical protein
MTVPKSKGIVDVVFRVVPDRGEGSRARGGGVTGQSSLLLTQPDEINKILDFIQPLLRQGPNLINQSLSVRGHDNGSSFRFGVPGQLGRPGEGINRKARIPGNAFDDDPMRYIASMHLPAPHASSGRAQ